MIKGFGLLKHWRTAAQWYTQWMVNLTCTVVFVCISVWMGKVTIHSESTPNRLGTWKRQQSSRIAHNRPESSRVVQSLPETTGALCLWSSISSPTSTPNDSDYDSRSTPQRLRLQITPADSKWLRTTPTLDGTSGSHFCRRRNRTNNSRSWREVVVVLQRARH